MDKLMDNPWFLRFTALFLAVILFVSIKAEENKVNGKTPGDDVDAIYEIPVEVFYDNENLVVTGVPETVNMTIEGPKNLVLSTKLLKDFTVFVDLNNLPVGKHPVEIQYENISEKIQVRLDPGTIDVVIEEKVTQTFSIDAELNDRLLAEDFYVVDMEVNPATIEVTGAKSIVDSISFVKVTATSDAGINESFEQKARVRVLDRDLNKLNVVISPEEVTVKVNIAEYNKEVPIKVKSRGVPTPGVVIDSLTASETQVTLSGPRKVLDSIRELSVDVDVSDIKGDGTIEIDLNKPKGVNTMSVEKIRVRVDATVTVIEDDVEDEDTAFLEEEETEQPIETKVFDNIQIAVKELDEKFNSTFLEPINGFLTLTVRAEKDQVETLEQSDFVVYVNMSETTDEGEQTLSVSVDGPDGVSWLLSESKVTMKIELA